MFEFSSPILESPDSNSLLGGLTQLSFYIDTQIKMRF
jgi:hypothetical protein